MPNTNLDLDLSECEPHERQKWRRAAGDDWQASVSRVSTVTWVRSKMAKAANGAPMSRRHR
jgi:hypothetical protein